MDDPGLLRAYLGTAWRVEAPGGALTLRLDRPAPPALRPGGVVTAWNPASHLRSTAENEEASGTLEEALRASDTPFWGVVAGGTGPGAELWNEPGFFLRGPVRPLLVALGTLLGQNAVVWVDGAGRAVLLATRSGFLGLRAGDEVRP